MKITLRALRLNAGFVGKEVAKKMKKCINWLYMIETGNRMIALDDAQKLCEIYGVPDLPINKIFLPKKVSKSAKRITKRKEKK